MSESNEHLYIYGKQFKNTVSMYVCDRFLSIKYNSMISKCSYDFVVSHTHILKLKDKMTVFVLNEQIIMF